MHIKSRSSFIASIAAIIILFILSLATTLASFAFSWIFILLFALSLLSRVWSSLLMKKVSIQIKRGIWTGFAGEVVSINLEIKNDKFLSVPKFVITIPLDKSLSLIPEEKRKTDQAEAIALLNKGYSSSLVGCFETEKVPSYGSLDKTIAFKAVKRGVFPLNDWTLSTLDGFGLSEEALYASFDGNIVIYPALIDVDVSLILEDISSTNTSKKGYLDDVSVIRSVKEYEIHDSTKYINWRLLAMGMPLSVNVYEKIRPKSVHFILDGESFSGKSKHLDELEECLSIISSLIIRLDSLGIKCYLSIPDSRSGAALCQSPEDGLERSLFLLSSYNPNDDILDERGLEVIDQKSLFDIESIRLSLEYCSSLFFFTYNISSQSFTQFEDMDLKIISYKEDKESKMPYILLSRLKRNM